MNPGLRFSLSIVQCSGNRLCIGTGAFCQIVTAGFDRLQCRYLQPSPIPVFIGLISAIWE